MTGSRARLASLALVVVMVMSIGATGTAVAGTSGNDSTAGNDAPEDSFVVTQGEDCYAATTLGDGSESVESFYNYSNDFDWSSEGTRHLQENQVSNLFVYNGSEGYSLVFLHDKHGDGPYGSTTTFNVYGQPADGEWAVEDDTYEGRDDNFNHYGSHSEIDWMWAPDRTDGAAFRGLTVEDDVAITVEPAFNEDASEWGSWAWSGDENNRTEAWKLLGEDGSTVATLDMNENATVTTGTCGDGPTAALSVNDSSPNAGQSVEFDASASTGDEEIVEYRWDVDGDGTVDETTASATATATYEKKGDYDATVTVVDASGNEDSASVTVSVTAEEDGEKDTEPPTAKLDVPEKTTTGTTVTLDASASTDNEEVVRYYWDFDGDGEFEKQTFTATVETTYETAGEYEPMVTVKDDAWNHDSANATITITDGEKDTEPPTADLTVPEKVTAGEEFTVEATNVTDVSGISHICWYYDGQVGPDGKTMTHSFEEAGTHNVSVRLVDGVGNEVTLTRDVEVVEKSSSDNGGSSGSDDSSSDDSDDSNSTPISNDHDPEPDISVTAVEVSDETVAAGDDVEFTVTLENAGDADGSHTVSLSAADVGDESTSVNVSADETRTVTLSTTFAEAGEYDVEVGGESFTIQVEAEETETESETESESESETDTETATATATETETDASGGAEAPDDEEERAASGETGPGFGVLSVLVATIIGVGVLRRRL